MSKDIVKEFWEKFIKGDLLERSNMVQSKIANRMMFLYTDMIDADTKKQLLSTALLGYFEDLVRVLETQKEVKLKSPISMNGG